MNFKIQYLKFTITLLLAILVKQSSFAQDTALFSIQPINNAVEFRRHLHANPELSTQEFNTSKVIVNELKSIGITKIYNNFSFNSILAEIDGINPGPTILFRCELDALPIKEQNEFIHKSKNSGVSHKCGHDGHMATMIRYAEKIMKNRPKNGKILLFFQSAEETGAGAKNALQSPIFKQYSIDYVFAYHNIGGFNLGEIVVKNGLFTPCVESGIFELIGKESHASEPSNGINPAKAIAECIEYLGSLNQPNKSLSDYFLATPIHIDMGEKAYGTSAGKALLGYTFRAWDYTFFEQKKEQILKQLAYISKKNQLKLNSNWIESFNANNNNEIAVQKIKQAATKQNFPIIELQKPFEFGEDFGLFTQKYKGAMFAVGIGKNHASLHSTDYDFPDELIEVGSNMFFQITQEILQ